MAATTLAGVNVSTARVAVPKAETPNNRRRSHALNSPPWAANFPWKTSHGGAGRVARVRTLAGGPSTPPGISEKVSESIKHAEEACAGDPASGECVAAWDEVEELSAAASHARDKLKTSDPLEAYCKDNPETDECRTYED